MSRPSFRLAPTSSSSIKKPPAPAPDHPSDQAPRQKAGVGLNPSTSTGMIEDILADIDLLLVMTVNPGFGGQRFIHSMLKIRRAHHLLQQCNARELEADGGVDRQTAPLAVRRWSRCRGGWNRHFRRSRWAESRFVAPHAGDSLSRRPAFDRQTPSQAATSPYHVLKRIYRFQTLRSVGHSRAGRPSRVPSPWHRSKPARTTERHRHDA